MPRHHQISPFLPDLKRELVIDTLAKGGMKAVHPSSLQSLVCQEHTRNICGRYRVTAHVKARPEMEGTKVGRPKTSLSKECRVHLRRSVVQCRERVCEEIVLVPEKMDRSLMAQKKSEWTGCYIWSPLSDYPDVRTERVPMKMETRSPPIEDQPKR